MGSVAGLLAGIATIGGVVALARFANRKSAELKSAVEEFRRQAQGDFDGTVLDYEQDPDDGVFRAKQLEGTNG
ncbi:MAG: hypothetical protein AAFY84_00480 [Pseudomonadota bacterium]